MKSMVAALWRGELCPESHAGLNSNEFRYAENKLEDSRKKLADALNERQKMLFEAYLNCLQDYINARDEQVFRDGFGMGVRLTSEGMLDSASDE